VRLFNICQFLYFSSQDTKKLPRFSFLRGIEVLPVYVAVTPSARRPWVSFQLFSGT